MPTDPLDSLTNSLLIAAAHARCLPAPQRLSRAYFLNNRLATALDAIAAQLNASSHCRSVPVRCMTDREMRLREKQAACLLAGLPVLAARYEALLAAEGR